MLRPQDLRRRSEGGQADLQDGRAATAAHRAEPVRHGLRGRRRAGRCRPPGRPRDPERQPRAKASPHEGRLLARLREPRLHTRTARFDGEDRAAARPRVGRARPRRVLRRRRDRRAQPGARRHTQRAHVRARPAGAGRRADDEHLLDLPGRAGRMSAAPGRQRRIPLADQRQPRRRWPVLREGPDEQEPAVAAGRGDRARDAPFEGQAAAQRPQGGAVLRLLHRASDRPARDRRGASSRSLHADGDRGARRHRDRLRRGSTSAAAFRSSR